MFPELLKAQRTPFSSQGSGTRALGLALVWRFGRSHRRLGVHLQQRCEAPLPHRRARLTVLIGPVAGLMVSSYP
jgi:hypothetical protein